MPRIIVCTGGSGGAAGGLLAANNLSDLANAATARTNLGLGTAATSASTAFDASGAASTAQSFSIQRANHTGTQSADTLTDGTTNKAFLATERTKLTGIATGAAAVTSNAPLAAATTTTVGTGTAAARDDHRHPRSFWDAADYGLIAWSTDPVACTTGGTALTSGQVNLIRVHIPVATTVTNILMYINTAGTTLTSGQCFAALYNSAGTLLSATADQSTAWASTQLKTMALTTPQSVAAGDYYVAFFSNGTTNPQFLRGPALASQLANFNLTAGNYRYATADTGRTTSMPATLGAMTALAQQFWCALS